MAANAHFTNKIRFSNFNWFQIELYARRVFFFIFDSRWNVSAFDGIESQISFMIVLFLTLFTRKIFQYNSWLSPCKSKQRFIQSNPLFRIRSKEMKQTNTDSWALDTLHIIHHLIIASKYDFVLAHRSCVCTPPQYLLNNSKKSAPKRKLEKIIYRIIHVGVLARYAMNKFAKLFSFRIYSVFGRVNIFNKIISDFNLNPTVLQRIDPKMCRNRKWQS